MFLGFPLSLSGSGAAGQELASSLGSLPMGRLLLIRARIALAHQLPTPQLAWVACGLQCFFMMRKETPKWYFSFSIRNSGVVWLGNLPGNQGARGNNDITRASRVKAEQLRTASRVASSNGFPYRLEVFRPSWGFGRINWVCRRSSPDWSFPFSHLPPGERITQRCSSCIPLKDQVPRALLSSCPILLLTTSQERGCNNRRHTITRAKEIVVAKIAAQLMNAARLNCVWRKERWIINFGGYRHEGILCMKINPYL